MADWTPTFCALRACILFVDSTAKKHHCYGIAKTLNIPVTTVFYTLRAMTEHGWLTAEPEVLPQNVDKGSDRARRVLYALTESGLDSAVQALTMLRVPVSGYRPSAH